MPRRRSLTSTLLRRCRRTVRQPSGVTLQCEYVFTTDLPPISAADYPAGFFPSSAPNKAVPALKWVLCATHAKLLQTAIEDEIRRELAEAKKPRPKRKRPSSVEQSSSNEDATKLRGMQIAYYRSQHP